MAKRGRKKSKWAKLNRAAGSAGRGFNAALELFMAELEAEAEELLEVFKVQIDELFSLMIARTPVKTGKLKKAWEIARLKDSESDLSVEVLLSNATFYLRFVEFGSSRQAPKGFIRVSFKDFKDKLVKILKGLRGNG